MKFLLTSAGVRNKSIHNALVEMLGKPISDCNALCIPTATYAFPGGIDGALRAWEFVSGSLLTECPMIELGWKSVGVLELTALPSLGKENWLPMVQEIDVLLVNGGDTLYLSYWMQQSGLAEILPSLRAVYVGLSAGSLVMSPTIAQKFVHWTPPTGGNKTLGVVDFEMFPHLDHPMIPTHAMSYAERWAAALSNPGYAMDDETAIKVVDGNVEVVSEGTWKLFTP
jgi:dipeptidase E